MQFGILITTFVFALAAGELPDTADPQYDHPIIADYGGVVDPTGTAEMPKANAKVLYDVTSDELDNGVIKGLDRAALLTNLYGAAGVKPENIRVAIILHADATKAALNDEAYRKISDGRNNPNLELIRRLKESGADLYVCLQALAHKNYSREDVVPEVAVAAAAATVIINKQMDGFAYNPF